MREFEKKNWEELKNFSDEELKQYYKELKEYYGELPNPKASIKAGDAFSPILLGILKTIRKKNLIFLNECPVDKKETMIFGFNHSNANDVPLATEIIGRHSYLLASDENKNDVSGLLFRIKGVVYLQRGNKESEKSAKTEMIKRALYGRDLMIFPEGAWNLEESVPMLELGAGIIDIAKITEYPIVPVVMEYEDKTNNVYVKYGMPLRLNYKTDRNEALKTLRDEMARLKYEIWETKIPRITREEYESGRYKEWKDELVKGYPKMGPEDIRKLAIKSYETYDDVMPINVNKLTLKR